MFADLLKILFKLNIDKEQIINCFIAIEQMELENKISIVHLRQLSNAGIPFLLIMSEILNTDPKELFDMIKKGYIQFEDIFPETVKRLKDNILL